MKSASNKDYNIEYKQKQYKHLNIKERVCRFVKHMRQYLMLKGFIAILLFFCC